MNQQPDSSLPAAPTGALGALDELLRRPSDLIERAGRADRLPVLQLLAGAVVCCAAYGAASGFFQGGGQILVTALKAPLIVLGSLLLCLPSLYVLASLAGVEVSPRWFAVTSGGLSGMLGLLLAAVLPIAWLFSVSSSSLGFMIFIHLVVWATTLGFALRFLLRAARARGAFSLLMWILLLFVVSLQVASQMRPVLWRPAGMALFAPRKVFFLEHLGRIVTGKEGPAAHSSDRED